MNERIQELSEQAEKYADDNFRGDPTWSEAFESKFAELIVRECMNKVRSRQRFAIEDDNNADHAFDLLLYDLETYFGVEE